MRTFVSIERTLVAYLICVTNKKTYKINGG